MSLKVSIIIPIYHVERYIERCIRSVLNQDYNNIEVILVDDGSNDKSIELARKVIEEFANKNSFKFHFFHHNENRGLSAARNTGIRNATGDYLYFLDSDDELPVNSISLLMEQVRLYRQVELVHGEMTGDGNSDFLSIQRYKDTPFIDDNSKIRRLFYTIHRPLPSSACNKLLLTKFIRNNNLYFKEGIIFEDSHWLYYVFKKLKYMAFVFHPTYIRFLNGGSIMTSLDIDKEIRNWGVILNEIVKTFDEPCYKEQLYTYFRKFMMYYDLSTGKYGFNTLYNSFIKLFFQQKEYMTVICLLVYKYNSDILPVEKIRARIRGFIFNKIETFFENK